MNLGPMATTMASLTTRTSSTVSLSERGVNLKVDRTSGWPSGLLVQAYQTCGGNNLLQGTVDGCSVFEASRDQAAADGCVANGQLVGEVGHWALAHMLIVLTYLQPVGLNSVLTALPGNNPEYNSSSVSPDYPKKPSASYIEKSQLVAVPQDLEGACKGTRCTDFDGPVVASQPSSQPVSQPAAESASTSASGHFTVTVTVTSSSQGAVPTCQ